MENRMEERLLGCEEDEKSELKWRVWMESKRVWSIAFPSMVARVTSYGIIAVTQVFLGHTGELDLAAYALIQSILVGFVNGILIGMSSATETLCGQAFGAKHYHMMGIYLQRSWIVEVVTTTIFLPLFILATPIFKSLGQQEAIAIAAKTISLWFIPFLYFTVACVTMQMYLQAQLKNMIIVWLSVCSFALHIFLSWIFVSVIGLGSSGAMGAMNIASCALAMGEFVYIVGGWCPDTWKGFTKAAFSDLWPVIKLSVSSGIMICLEVWYTAILVFLAGYMKNAAVEISAFSICLNINVWELMISFGFLGAACVRVSNELGKGDAKAVKFSIKVILSTSICIGVFFFAMCLAFGHQISYWFTSSEEVAESVSDLSVLLAFSILLNSVQPVLTGVAVGSGLQNIVAIVNLGCYYLIGLPIGILLGYLTDLQVKGLWMGLLSGVAMQTFVLSCIIWRTDWDEQVNKTNKRLSQWFLDPAKESKQDFESAREG